MKMTAHRPEVKMDHVLDICVDISQDTLNAAFDIGGTAYDDAFTNTTRAIETTLQTSLQIAKAHGKPQLRIICEPSGGYQDKLLRTARRMGQLTAYVFAEAVAKFRVVETNDSGKTDLKDPHVIGTLAKLGKTCRHRLLDGEYLLLRKWGILYADVEEAIVLVKNRLHHALLELFCDYSFKKDFLYSASGRALMTVTDGNPYQIIAMGYDAFAHAMKPRVPRIKTGSLQRLWHDAQSSSRHQLAPDYVALLGQQLQSLWQDYLQAEQRKTAIGQQLDTLYARLRALDPKLPASTPGVITAKNLARLLGETGPLGDFGHWRPLLRYAGLNIRMRQSGKDRGHYKMSKKGRPLLRKILAQVVLPLVRRGQLYGDFYQAKKQGMPGNKAMTVIMRHFLRKLYGWDKSGQAFDRTRFFTCQSAYQPPPVAA